MKRREFVGGLASFGVVAPSALHAQPTQIPVIGYLTVSAQQSRASQTNIATFKDALQAGGFIDGKTVQLEYRFGGGQESRLRTLAIDLICVPVRLIFASGTASAMAAKAATSAVPIIFSGGSDPVSLGLVDSFNRPGANVTGVTIGSHLAAAKRVELLRNLIPRLQTVALLISPDNPSTQSEIIEHQAAAGQLGLQAIILSVSNDAEVRQAIAELSKQENSGLVVASGPFFGNHRDLIIAEALLHRIPAVYGQTDASHSGGLMSYGGSLQEGHRLATTYAVRVLRGERPGDLPIQVSSKFQLMINLKTARAMSFDIPAALLAAADEVIE